MLSARRGLTLLELCVALTLTSLLLAVVVTTGVREQRLHLAVARLLASSERLRQGAAMMPIDLRALDPAAGDLRAGAASDTALEIRATIAAGIVCVASGYSAALVPWSSHAGALSSFVTAPEAGDTIWVLTPDDSSERWRPISLAGSAPARGRCPAASPAFVAPDESDDEQLAFDLSTAAESAGVVAGAPVRITRPARYSIYRASDGHWYLGLHEWSTSRARFDVVQPVSGPFDAGGSASVRFRYVDGTGIELATPVAAPERVARIELVMVQPASLSASIGTRARSGAPESMRVVAGLRSGR